FGDTGLRVIYARMFRDRLAPGTADLFREERAKAPEVTDAPTVVPLERTLAELERLGRAYGPSGNGRVQVWPSPATTAATSPEALRRTAELAKTLRTRWALHLPPT